MSRNQNIMISWLSFGVFFLKKSVFWGVFGARWGFFVKAIWQPWVLRTTHQWRRRVREGTLKVLCVVCCCFLYSIPYEGKAMNLLRGLETRAADIEGGQL
uniref:Uncharacterized protein n=1 Tax=Cacopsylla melanoneura TaxID=428564 RepID=A0A8D8LSQ9_9HEMI